MQNDNVKFKNELIVIITVMLLGCFSLAFAAFNEQINYQGKLTASNDAAVADGNKCMKFALYDVATSGASIWSEEWATTDAYVTTTSGLFSVLLGSNTSLSSVNFNQDPLYLEVQYDASCDGTYEEVFSPRKRLGAVPAAFEAKKLGGSTWASPGTIGSSTPSSGAFTTLSASGLTTLSYTPQGTGVSQGSLYINPASATSDYTLLGLAVNGSEKFKIDEDGDLVKVGNITMADSGWLGLGSSAGQISFTDAATDYVIFSNANVGIGTTEPSTKLHVAGQCVTGETELPILQSGANFQFSISNFQSIPNDLIFKQIKDVKEGDYVLSLNEETNKIEPHRINGLLDMGVQPVFRLTTESGKTIKTTGNHPYLAIQNNQKTANDVAVLEDSNVVRDSGLSTYYQYSKPKDLVKTETEWTKVIYLQPGDEIAVVEDFGEVRPPESLRPDFGEVGPLASSSISFEHIVSIDYVGEEQVYDIEVEGTHNFIANGIVAHNTYIVSTSTPQLRLGYDATNDAQFSVNSSGDLTITAYGGDISFDNENLSTTGTISSATWQGVAVGAGYGGTGQSSYATGDMLYASGPTALSKLNIGTADYVLTSSGTAPQWSNSLTLAGDIAVNGGDITSTGALTITPAAGSNLNISLSATGDFVVNTSQLYVDTSTGYIGIGTTGPDRKLDVLDASNPQLRLTNTDGSIYTDFSVAATTGDLTVSLYPSTTGNDFIINMPSGTTGANLWVCQGDACPTTGWSLGNGGNLVVENGVYFPGAVSGSTPFKINPTGTNKELGVYDSSGDAVIIFDEATP